jgi:hypothetical protein
MRALSYNKLISWTLEIFLLLWRASDAACLGTIRMEHEPIVCLHPSMERGSAMLRLLCPIVCLLMAPLSSPAQPVRLHFVAVSEPYTCNGSIS